MLPILQTSWAPISVAGSLITPPARGARRLASRHIVRDLGKLTFQWSEHGAENRILVKICLGIGPRPPSQFKSHLRVVRKLDDCSLEFRAALRPDHQAALRDNIADF